MEVVQDAEEFTLSAFASFYHHSYLIGSGLLVVHLLHLIRSYHIITGHKAFTYQSNDIALAGREFYESGG